MHLGEHVDSLTFRSASLAESLQAAAQQERGTTCKARLRCPAAALHVSCWRPQPLHFESPQQKQATLCRVAQAWLAVHCQPHWGAPRGTTCNTIRLWAPPRLGSQWSNNWALVTVSSL